MRVVTSSKLYFSSMLILKPLCTLYIRNIQKSANGTPPPTLIITLLFPNATLNKYKNIRCKKAHVSVWQLELHRVKAMLTPLTYNSLKLYRVNTRLNLILIDQHVHCIKKFLNKYSQQPVCYKTIYIYDNTVVCML